MASGGNRHRGCRDHALQLKPVTLTVMAAILLAWLALSFWHAAKPLPPGTRITGVFRRLAESDVEFIGPLQPRELLARQITLIGRAEQLVALDQSPVPREVSQALLLRKHARPNLKIIVLTDPANSAFGGTLAQDLSVLERAGIVVARVDLDRLRDSNALYSGVWRLVWGWWSNPFDETPGAAGLAATARHLNFKADQRQLVVADDGSGGWGSLVGNLDAGPALLVHGAMARDILGSELQLAAWSTEDDRLPALPGGQDHGVGTLDARFLSEGALAAPLLDAMAGTRAGDAIRMWARHLGERRVILAALQAAARGVHVQLLLDDEREPNLAVAGEIANDGGANIEMRWHSGAPSAHAQLFQIRHGEDAIVFVTSANPTRRALGDLNLEAGIEVHLSSRASLSRSADAYFTRAWSAAVPVGSVADNDSAAYWLYRLKESTGLARF